MLYRECGLKGLSGISNDMRELEASTDPRAAFAIEYFVYRVGLNAGMLAAALGRARCVRVHGGHRREFGGDAQRASQKSSSGSAPDSIRSPTRPQSSRSRGRELVALYVVPTDEELMIARHTLALIDSCRPGNIPRAAIVA